MEAYPSHGSHVTLGRGFNEGTRSELSPSPTRPATRKEWDWGFQHSSCWRSRKSAHLGGSSWLRDVVH